MATKQLTTNELGTKERTPLHKQREINKASRPGYMRRIVNDLPGRIDDFKLAGWAIVEGQENAPSLVQQNTAAGSPVSMTVNRNPSAPNHRGVLMEIEEDYYNEVHKEKMQILKESEKELGEPTATADLVQLEYK